MHHVALDRAGPHDRHLDDEIVEFARLQARQHVHLRPAFDLEDADASRPCTACRSRPVVGRHVGEAHVLAFMRAQIGRNALRMQVSMPSASTSTFIRPSASMSSLSHSMKVRSSIAALPIGHELVEPPARQHEAADMLREMARKAEQPRREIERRARSIGLSGSSPAWRMCACRQCRVPQLPQCVLASAAVTSSVRPKRLADFADGAARPIADDGRGDAGAVAAVALVDILDHLLAPLMLEIDVDVGRLLALLRDEAREQQIVLRRIDAGDAEHIADGGIGRRAAPLAENAPVFGESARCRERSGNSARSRASR